MSTTFAELHTADPMVVPARITTKYQVTIPKSVRKDLRIATGDLVVFTKDGGNRWVLRRIPRDAVEVLRVAGRGLPGTAQEVHAELEAGWRDLDREPGFRLGYLLAGVTAQNLHREVDTGPLAGNEVW